MAARGAGAFPIAAICCLGLILLAIAATIVLALIPIYLKSKDAKLAPINSVQTTTTYSVPLSTAQPSGPLSASETGQISNALQASQTSSTLANGGLAATGASVGNSGRRKRQLGFFLIIVVLIFGRNRRGLNAIKRRLDAFILAQVAFLNALLASIIANRSTTTAATTALASTTAAAASTTAGSGASTTASGRRRRSIFLRRQAYRSALEPSNTYKD